MEVIAQLIVEKSKITFSWNFWFLNSWFQADVIFEGDGCIILTPKPPPLTPISLVSQLCQKRQKWYMQNHTYIRQLVQELMKYFRASVGHTCCLLFINHYLLTAIIPIYSFVPPKFLKAKHLCWQSYILGVILNNLFITLLNPHWI